MSDGGFDSPTFGACAEYVDAGLAMPVDGGWYLPQRRMDLTKCRLASCQAAVDAPAEPVPPLPLAYGLGLAGVAIAAFLAGWVLKK